MEAMKAWSDRDKREIENLIKIITIHPILGSKHPVTAKTRKKKKTERTEICTYPHYFMNLVRCIITIRADKSFAAASLKLTNWSYSATTVRLREALMEEVFDPSHLQQRGLGV